MSQEPEAATMSIAADFPGRVVLDVPDRVTLQLSPEQARKLATSLFIKAAHAEGSEAPELIVLKSS